MIANERQYRIARAELERFEAALARVDTVYADRPPRLRRAMREQLASQTEELREQLDEYDALRAGRVTVLDLTSLSELPDALIKARIARRWTQRALGERVGVAEQQIQKYEATHYAEASFARIQSIAETLGIEVSERVRLLPAISPEVESGERNGD